MKIIPAVDIKDGKAVRLKQGKADQQTIYDDDPVHAALRWAEQGPRRIHIVDLDGAFDGTPKNKAITLKVLRALAGKLEIQIGGGLRRNDDIAAFLDAGASRCVIGTKALEDRGFLRDLAHRFPGRISAGLDAKKGLIVTKGWVETSQTRAVDLVGELSDLPLAEVIYTDIDRDGMLLGPNFKQLTEMKRASNFPLIASGGITTVEHVQACRDLGCYGAIVGKAFYDGRLSIAEALAAAGEQ